VRIATYPLTMTYSTSQASRIRVNVRLNRGTLNVNGEYSPACEG
jgi:hypothetical protein